MEDIKHILVAYKGEGPAEDELLRMGCRVAREVRARVSVIHIVEVPMWIALDSAEVPGATEAESLVEHCDRVASEIGVNANAETVNARNAGSAIVDQAKSMGADLLFLGSGEASRAHRNPLGSTSDFVLRNASCSVVVGRFHERQNGA